MQLSPSAAVPVAGTYLGPVVHLDPALGYLVAEAQLAYGSGGTTIDVYVQTSLDGGTTWIDIINFHMTTANFAKVSAVTVTTALAASAAVTDGSLASGTILSGLLGDRLRTKTVVVGTYAASTLRVDAIAKAA